MKKVNCVSRKANFQAGAAAAAYCVKSQQRCSLRLTPWVYLREHASVKGESVKMRGKQLATAPCHALSFFYCVCYDCDSPGNV